MSDDNRGTANDAPLNPALKSTTEIVYDTDHITPAPVDTASAKEGEGEGWPVIWLVVVVICVAFTIYFVL